MQARLKFLRKKRPALYGIVCGDLPLASPRHCVACAWYIPCLYEPMMRPAHCRAHGVAALVLGLCLLTPPALAQTDSGQWITRPALPTPRQEMPHAVLDGKIYVIGGITGAQTASNVVEVYDPATGLWSTATSMPVSMHHLTLAAAHGKLYVLGGYLGNSFSPSGRVFEYDPATDGWTEKARMPTIRGAHIAVTVNGLIYVIGGAAFGAILGTNEVYNPAANTWTTLPPMPTSREHLAAAAIGDVIYVVGGRASLNNFRTLEAFDTDTGAWHLLQGMPTARGGLAAAALHGKLYVFGGEFPGVFPQNEVYDPATDQWEQAAPMPAPRHGIGAVAVADTIFIIGGGPVAGFGVTNVNAGFVPPAPTPTALDADEAPPDEPTLPQNHPNPFATATTIRFTTARPADITLAIYDLLGRVVATPVRQRLPAGRHAVAWHPDGLPGGVYLYRLNADGYTATKTMMLIR